MRMRITIGISALAALLVALPARADRRTLIRAYEYQTQPKDNLELEIWNDLAVPKADVGGIADTQITQRVELEYGLTDHWDIALYHVFTSGGPKLASGDHPGFGFDSWRVETRYRFAEKNVWPVDVMVYFELERPANFEEGFEAEEKLILEKSFGRLALVSNLVAEQKLLNGQGYAMELDLGARYEVAPQLRLGGEFWVTRDISRGGVSDTQAFVGPSISFAAPRFWLQLGTGFGLTGVADTETRAFVRSVLGFNL